MSTVFGNTLIDIDAPPKTAWSVVENQGSRNFRLSEEAKAFKKRLFAFIANVFINESCWRLGGSCREQRERRLMSRKDWVGLGWMEVFDIVFTTLKTTLIPSFVLNEHATANLLLTSSLKIVSVDVNNSDIGA